MNEFIERISKLSPKRLVLLAADLQTRLQAAEQAAGAAHDSDANAIAVIGMGLRFPGGAQSPDEFWDFLCRGGDGIRKTPAERWDVDALYDPDPDAPGKLASQWGGFIDGIDQFDPQFFGITPREANTMDPQQRLMLELCWQTLERAGYAPDRLGGSQTGVFVGACNGDYYHMVLGSGNDNLEMYTATGSAHSVISGRISYLLGLQGPSLTVDTACSSSLVALHLACRSLRNGECRLALAGGVNALLSPDTTIVLSKAKMMAPDGHCKAFDAAADGFVRSEGCGVILLKRLADAQADGDQILAVVRGSAINQDGRSNGLTAPNGPSQVAVVRAALADAGVEPAAVGYVETHGTGTSLGDPIEVQALAEALGPGRAPDRPLLIGSVKTNLGHLESAAGVAGFIKLVLALQHRTIPPHLHLKQLNPYIAWDELPLRVPAAGGAWDAIGGRWLGGVSSFGFSGTNVHMVVEAAPASAANAGQASSVLAAPAGAVLPDRPLHLLQLSARSGGALQAQAANFAAHLAAHDLDLADVAYTANTGRALFAHRLALAAASSAEAQAKLRAFAQDPGRAEIAHGQTPGNRKPSVAFLFSGHGGQYAGMGRELYAAQPVFRSAFDQCAELFRPYLDGALHTVFESAAPGAPAAWMESMTLAQPALFALQVALAQMWRSWGVEPAAVAGHSIGEYAAACVAGVLRLEDAVKLVAARARLMDVIPEKGAMAAVFADEAQVAQVIATEIPAPLAARVAIAAINGPQATVISGSSEAVEAVAAALARVRVRSRRLAVAQGAHSPLIDAVLAEFAVVAAGIDYAEPQLTFVSSLFGRAAATGEISQPDYWRRHLRETVRFADAMAALQAGEHDVFVEIGPSPMLMAMGQRCLPGHAAIWVPSLRPDSALPATAPPASGAPAGREWRQVLDSAAALFTYGVDLDWAAFDRPYARRRLPLPTYPFERQRYWFATSAAQPRTRRADWTGETPPAHPLLGRRLRSPALQGEVFEGEIGRHAPAFLSHHTIFGEVILPSPAYLEMALAAAARLFPQETCALANFTIHAPLLLPEEGLRTVQLVLQPAEAAGALNFQVLAAEAPAGRAAAEDAGPAWKLHASGMLQRPAGAGENGGAAAAPGNFSPAVLQDRCPQHVSGADYYAQVHSLGLTFGESFQGIQDVWIGAGEALGRIVLPAPLADEVQDYRFHPALLDACFHLLGAPLAKNGMDAASLLIGIDRFQLHRPPSAELWNHTRIVQLPGPGAETYTGDILLYDGSGQLVAEVHGLQLKRADRAALQRAIGRRAQDWVYTLEWQRANSPVAPVTTHPQTWLILADAAQEGTPGVGRQLAQRLADRGDRCVLVDEQDAAGFAADQFAALLAGAELQSLHRIVFLWGTPAGERSAGDTAAALLRLVQAFVRQGRSLPGGLWLATRGAQAVAGAPDEGGLRQTPLWGLGRVIALEQPQLWGGMVDLDREDKEAAATLLAELDGSDGEDQAAWRQGARYVARLQPAQRPAPRQAALRRDGAYLITGGLGGLGLAAARWLAQHGAGHLVLIGRRGLPPRAQWPQLMAAQAAAADGAAAGAAAAASARQVLAVTEIEQLGAAVTVLAADVADAASMAVLFARFGADLPALRGILHTAADLSSAPVVELDDARLQAMLRPKVQGTWNLHRLSAQFDLDFFVLFSSTTALLGASGLAHYAAANAWLDAFAHYRRGLGLPALSINWGTWSIMRAASGAEQQRVAEFGLEQMPAEQALELLGDFLLNPQPPQVAIAAVNWAALKPAYEARRRRPLLALLGAAQRTAPATQLVLPSTTAAQGPELPAAWRAARPEDRQEVVVEAVRATVAKIIGVRDPSTIDLHQGLFEMGLDSLMSVELKTRLERQVGCALPSTLTFNYPTVHDLAGYLEQQVLAMAAPAEPAASIAPAPVIAGAGPAGAAANGDIDELSEDELAARLLQRLQGLR